MQETWVRSLGQEDPLEKEMATHSSELAWRIPGTGELGGLPSMGSHRVGYDSWAAVYAQMWPIWNLLPTQPVQTGPVAAAWVPRKSGPGNGGLSECGTTHEAMSRISL